MEPFASGFGQTMSQQTPQQRLARLFFFTTVLIVILAAAATGFVWRATRVSEQSIARSRAWDNVLESAHHAVGQHGEDLSDLKTFLLGTAQRNALNYGPDAITTLSSAETEEAAVTALEAELLRQQNDGIAHARRDRRLGLLLGTLATAVAIISGLVGKRLASQLGNTESERARDLALIEEHAASVRAANHRLSLSNRDLAGFAFVASHDLQEPLRKIIAFGDRLERNLGENLDPTGKDYLVRMQNAATRMQRLIDDLLSYARTSSKPTVMGMVDLNSTCRDVVSDLELAIEQSGATITVGELPTIEGDSTQLGQLLQNLLSNALKFAQPGIAPRVTISCVALGKTHAAVGEFRAMHPAAKKWFELTIADNGIGFDQAYADKVFLVFQRLHSRDQFAGSGLGMSVARKVVERHTGMISVTSEANVGTTFSIILPDRQPVEVLAESRLHDTDASGSSVSDAVVRPSASTEPSTLAPLSLDPPTELASSLASSGSGQR
jgi:signal transduction histidine kinase